jgi:hypothetical protein
MCGYQFAAEGIDEYGLSVADGTLFHGNHPNPGDHPDVRVAVIGFRVEAGG